LALLRLFTRGLWHFVSQKKQGKITICLLCHQQTIVAVLVMNQLCLTTGIKSYTRIRILDFIRWKQKSVNKQKNSRQRYEISKLSSKKKFSFLGLHVQFEFFINTLTMQSLCIPAYFFRAFKHMQLFTSDSTRFLNKPYVNGVTLREQNLSLKCCQPLQLLFWKGVYIFLYS